MNWKDYLTPQERKRIERIDKLRADVADLSVEYRKIFDRARQRMKREQENRLENQPANPQKTAD